MQANIALGIKHVNLEVIMSMGIETIAGLTETVVGPTEENVKQKIVVPLLELLGHKRENMNFEYRTQSGGKIDILLGKSLPPDCKVIIDTKNYNVELNVASKARIVTLDELVKAGHLKDGETLFLCYLSREFKDETAQVIAHSNKLKYKDGKFYSKTQLASKLLLKYKVIKNPSVQGPKFWKTSRGKLLHDLEQQVRK